LADDIVAASGPGDDREQHPIHSATARQSGGSITASAVVAPRWRFSARARKAALTFHVISSVGLVGATASVILLAARAATADAVDAHALYESGGMLALALAIPFSFASLITGLALGVGTIWGVFRYYWVVAKIGLLVAILAMGALVVGPSTDILADRTAAGLEGSGLGDRRWLLAGAGAANLSLMVAATILAIYKPWGRIRRAAMK
jgi:hypothetical protein